MYRLEYLTVCLKHHMKTEIVRNLSVTFTMVCISIPVHFQQLFYSVEYRFQSIDTVKFYAELGFYQGKELRSLAVYVSEAVDKMNCLSDLAEIIPMLEYG